MKSYQNNLKEAFNNVLGSEFQIDILTEDQMELQEESKRRNKKVMIMNLHLRHSL